ncbi:hypothetical protein CBR_g27757 [Chara braunii]|uniref:Core domain-containing protein n=1 Tax=Chara braunii TaxID=69332 RepID=A0A388L8G7_CHABU|nr:hypothetical protein CBR_g27757 [Chara braunii]|eukprot:GBG78532.1 hypothetical protein CBR_g27757 [Chara braunii]
MATVVRELADACACAARRVLHLRSPGCVTPAPSRRLARAAPSWLMTTLPRHRQLSFASVHHNSVSALAGAETANTSSGSTSAEASGRSEDLVISENCIRRMREIQEEEREEAGAAGEVMLRLSVDGGGCSGFQYSFSLERELQPDDRVFEKDGVKVVVDSVSHSFVKGATIDYVQELVRSSFHVANNPNSAATCGCGSSFTAR